MNKLLCKYLFRSSPRIRLSGEHIVTLALANIHDLRFASYSWLFAVGLPLWIAGIDGVDLKLKAGSAMHLSPSRIRVIMQVHNISRTIDTHW